MNPGDLVLTEKLITEVAACVRSVLARKFPSMPLPQRQDVEQEVLLKLCRMAENGKTIVHLRSYLWKVVATTALDILEPEQGTLSLEEFLEKAGSKALPEAMLTASREEALEGRRHLESLLAGLPERRRIVVKLHLAGWDIERSAAWLGWTQAKTRHLLYRGLATLKEMSRRARQMKEENEREADGLPVERCVREGLSD
jgi:RNA polymerase sigma factor (sigma-70 family)